MATYAYVARDPAGRKTEGRLTAVSESAAFAELQARDLAPVAVRPLRQPMQIRRRVSSRQLATAYRQLADLLRAGVPLLRALRLLGRSKSNPRLAAVMTAIADDVADGSRLDDAMAKHPDIFPPVQLAMVRAGERGGFLETVLSRMGAFLEHQADMRGKVIGNLIYPFVLLFVGVAVVVVALLFFVPRFEEYYSRIEIPLPTQIMLASSKLLSGYWPLVLLGVAGIIALVWMMLRNETIRRTLAIWQLKIPTLGPLVQSLAVGRFTRILGTLLGNGIPMLQAMQIARDAAGHPLLAEAIDRATEAVRAGESLARPLASSGLIADDVIEMIAVGESANNLPEVLITIAETIESRTDRMLALFLKLMEPALLLMLAGVVLFIFIALIVPMLRMSSALAR